MEIKSKLFGNGKITTYFVFSSGKKVTLTQEEAKELSDKINLGLRCGLRKVNFIGDYKCGVRNTKLKGDKKIRCSK